MELRKRPGIFTDIPLEEYLAWEAVGASDLSNMIRSPAYCRYKQQNPDEDKQTPAKRLGSAIHCILLEPDEWGKRYCVDPQSPKGGYPAGWRNSGAYKDLVAGISMNLLPMDDFAACLLIQQNMEESEFCKKGLSRADLTEVSAKVADLDLVVTRKVRPDALIVLAEMIVDVKTTRADTPEAFARQALDLGYHRSAAYYLDTMNRVMGPGTFQHYVFLTVANTPPYEIRPFTLDEDSIDLGRVEYLGLMEEYARCLHNDVWPGRAKWIEEIRLPGYAFQLDRRNA